MNQPPLLPRNVERRKPVHGVSIGIMILDTGFERFDGDIGYAPTFPFPVQYAVIPGATPNRALKANADGMLELFLRGIDQLVALGVDGIATSCGFLSILQPQLVAYSPVPVVTSSLLQVPVVQMTLPPSKRVAVLTADKEALTRDHLVAVGCPEDTLVVGLKPGSLFLENCRNGVPTVDREAQQVEILEAGERLVRAHHNVGAIVLECTNFPSYAGALQRRIGLPVFDIVTLLNWFHAGLRRAGGGWRG